MEIVEKYDKTPVWKDSNSSVFCDYYLEDTVRLKITRKAKTDVILRVDTMK